MSFNFGGADTKMLAGVTATLKEWPSLGGLSLESEAAQGRDARYFYGANQTHSTFVFDVIIEGYSPEDVFERRDNFIGLIAPSRGALDLVVEIDTAWQWLNTMVSEQVNWSRYTWGSDVGYRLRADVTFETVGDASAIEVVQNPVTFASTLNYTLSKGNTDAYPHIEFPSGAQATVNIGGFSVVVAATPAGLTNVLDYRNFEFYQKNSSGSRLRSIVRYMSHYQRASLTVGQTVTVSAVGAPAGTRRFYPNARRI